MPVPKRKTSKARRDSRSAGKFIRPKTIAKCSNCEYPLVPHIACKSCGFYKGKKVLKTKVDRSQKRVELRATKKPKDHHDHEGHDHKHEHDENK